MSKVTAKNTIRRNRILRVLLEEGALSLADLSRRTGISLPMVSKLATAMKRERMIETVHGTRGERAGRPPIIARLRGSAGHVIGIDLGHRNTNVVLLDLEKKIVEERHIGSESLSSDPHMIDWLLGVVNDTNRSAGVDERRLLGVGLSVPGFVRGQLGISESYLNFSGATVQELLEARLQKPVHIEHDAKAMLLGERWFGAAREAADVLCLNIGWGLGLGVLVHGKTLYGHRGYAGEFGHIQVVKDGRPCYCGGRGCLETVASGMAIGLEARERAARGEAKTLLGLAAGDPEAIDTELVATAALAGDAVAAEVVAEAGRHIGEGVAQLINLFNPELVILGGRVSMAARLLLDPVREAALRIALPQLGRGVEFTLSTLGTNAGALGAAMLATRDLFEVEHLNPTAYV